MINLLSSSSSSPAAALSRLVCVLLASSLVISQIVRGPVVITNTTTAAATPTRNTVATSDIISNQDLSVKPTRERRSDLDPEEPYPNNEYHANPSESAEEEDYSLDTARFHGRGASNSKNGLQDPIQQQEQLQNKPPDPVNTCHGVIQRMHEWNDCWRRHILNLEQQNLSEEHLKLELTKKISCPVLQDSNDGSSKEFAIDTIGAPLYHFAYYQAQGFGRVISHSVEACLMSFILHRPCLINMSPRDPYNTWRSFIQQNTYHWDPSILHSIPPYVGQIEELLSKMKNIGAGSFGSMVFRESDYYNSSCWVFPMHTKFDNDKWKTAIEYYSYESENSKTMAHQVLVTCNWGDAWFTRIPIKDIFRDHYDCDHDILRTQLQNAMFGPTDLSLRLHEARYNTAVSTTWDETIALKVQDDKPRVILPVTSAMGSTSNRNDAVRYGSVHVRLHFINEKRQTPMHQLELATKIRSCIQRASQLYHHLDKKSFPQHWWLLADDASMVPKLVRALERQERRKEQPFDNNAAVPHASWFHTYNESSPMMDEAEKRNKKEVQLLSSKHSMSSYSTGLYGHTYMQGSIEDWMALQASDVSIVVQVGSFGTTGARGKGKVPIAFCGEGRADDKRQTFQIFFQTKTKD